MKKLSRIVLVCIFIICMVVPSFAESSAFVYLSGQQITEGSPVSGISLQGTILTINNCNFSGEGFQFNASPTNVSTGLYAFGITEIVLEGSSTITTVNNATQTDMICGLYVLPTEGILTVRGTGSARFVTQTAGRQYADGAMILGGMTIQSGTLFCEASAANSESIGLNAWGNVIVASGSSLKGFGKTATSSMGIAVASGCNLTLEDGCYLLATSVNSGALSATVVPNGASLVASVQQDGSSKVLFSQANMTQYRYVETGTLQNTDPDTPTPQNHDETSDDGGGYYVSTADAVVTSVKTADSGMMGYLFSAIGAFSGIVTLKKKSWRSLLYS